jgi:hypothetical protein
LFGDRGIGSGVDFALLKVFRHFEEGGGCEGAGCWELS